MDHFYDKIEGWFYEDDKRSYDRAVYKYNSGDIFVEVGSFKGRSSIAMAVNIINSGKDIKFYCVDTWLGSIEHQSGQDSEDKDVINNNLKNIFIKNIESVKNIITSIEKTSIEAANDFENSSLSFVFIDASHDYENVKKDLEAWYPKIKKGGTLAGHDWTWPDVSRAVVEFANNKRLHAQNNIWEIYL
jgi:hypothetical protein